MKKIHRIQFLLRSISAALVLSFLCEQLAWASPVVSPSLPSPSRHASYVLPVPDSVAALDEVWLGGGSTGVIYLIQDAHTNPTAQLNLAKTLDALFQTDTALKTVFVEGGFGNDTLSPIKKYTSDKIRGFQARSDLRKGLLHGEEYLNLTGERPFVIWGVEDRRLYENAISSYGKTLAQRPQLGLLLGRIQNAEDYLRGRLLNPLLLAFDEQRMAYSAGQISLTDYLEILQKNSRQLKLGSRHPELEKLWKLRALEAVIDFNAARAEQIRVLAGLASEERADLENAAHKPRKLGARDIREGDEAYWALFSEKLPGIDLDSALSKYLQYRKQARTLNLPAVLDQIQSLEEGIIKNLTLHQDEADFLDAERFLAFQKKLFAFTLTSDEFESYMKLSRKAGVSEVLGFINKKLMEDGRAPEKALFLDEAHEALIREAESFYQITRDRDEAFVANMLQELLGTGPVRQSAVLIAGGYHTKNLKAILRLRGISYVSIMPRALEETNISRYEQILLGKDRSVYKLLPTSRLAGRMARTPSLLDARDAGSRLSLYMPSLAQEAIHEARSAVKRASFSEALLAVGPIAGSDLDFDSRGARLSESVSETGWLRLAAVGAVIAGISNLFVRPPRFGSLASITKNIQNPDSLLSDIPPFWAAGVALFGVGGLALLSIWIRELTIQYYFEKLDSASESEVRAARRFLMLHARPNDFIRWEANPDSRYRDLIHTKALSAVVDVLQARFPDDSILKMVRKDLEDYRHYQNRAATDSPWDEGGARLAAVDPGWEHPTVEAAVFNRHLLRESIYYSNSNMITFAVNNLWQIFQLRSASEAARLLAMIFIEEGSPLLGAQQAAAAANRVNSFFEPRNKYSTSIRLAAAYQIARRETNSPRRQSAVHLYLRSALYNEGLPIIERLIAATHFVVDYEPQQAVTKVMLDSALLIAQAFQQEGDPLARLIAAINLSFIDEDPSRSLYAQGAIVDSIHSVSLPAPARFFAMQHVFKDSRFPSRLELFRLALEMMRLNQGPVRSYLPANGGARLAPRRRPIDLNRIGKQIFHFPDRAGHFLRYRLYDPAKYWLMDQFARLILGEEGEVESRWSTSDSDRELFREDTLRSLVWPLITHALSNAGSESIDERYGERIREVRVRLPGWKNFVPIPSQNWSQSIDQGNLGIPLQTRLLREANRWRLRQPWIQNLPPLRNRPIPARHIQEALNELVPGQYWYETQVRDGRYDVYIGRESEEDLDPWVTVSGGRLSRSDEKAGMSAWIQGYMGVLSMPQIAELLEDERVVIRLKSLSRDRIVYQIFAGELVDKEVEIERAGMGTEKDVIRLQSYRLSRKRPLDENWRSSAGSAEFFWTNAVRDPQNETDYKNILRILDDKLDLSRESTELIEAGVWRRIKSKVNQKMQNAPKVLVKWPAGFFRTNSLDAAGSLMDRASRMYGWNPGGSYEFYRVTRPGLDEFFFIRPTYSKRPILVAETAVNGTRARIELLQTVQMEVYRIELVGADSVRNLAYFSVSRERAATARKFLVEYITGLSGDVPASGIAAAIKNDANQAMDEGLSGEDAALRYLEETIAVSSASVHAWYRGMATAAIRHLPDLIAEMNKHMATSRPAIEYLLRWTEEDPVPGLGIDVRIDHGQSTVSFEFLFPKKYREGAAKELSGYTLAMTNSDGREFTQKLGVDPSLKLSFKLPQDPFGFELLEPEYAGARMAAMKPIVDIAAQAGLLREEIQVVETANAAKIDSGKVQARLKDVPDAKVILVTAISPTTAGEGKTTTAIGLVQGFGKIGEKAMVVLREPSLGPLVGQKGGATGAGRATLEPGDEINWQFTGDIPAVEWATNQLAAMIDNHLRRGNILKIDPDRITWPRAVDISDSSLRSALLQVEGAGPARADYERKTRWVITAASEVMAILALASDMKDLRRRLGRIIVAYTTEGRPVTAEDLEAAGVLALALRHAIKPNLVQTQEGQPALIHAGPFANVAHGNSSVIALNTARKLTDYVVTEAGFGADLGAEKFFDIVARQEKVKPNLAVIVVTAKALKLNGGMTEKELKANASAEVSEAALERGFANLGRHVANMKKFGIPVLIAINRFPSDSVSELDKIRGYASHLGVRAELSEGVVRGGEGAADLARAAREMITSEPNNFQYLYDLNIPIAQKIEALAAYYGADGVDLSDGAKEDIRLLEEAQRGNFFEPLGLDVTRLPVNMAKTQYSFSHNPKLLGAPEGWRLNVASVRLSAGAGFLVVQSGEINLLPGLAARPAAMDMDINPKESAGARLTESRAKEYPASVSEWKAEDIVRMLSDRASIVESSDGAFLSTGIVEKETLTVNFRGTLYTLTRYGKNSFYERGTRRPALTTRSRRTETNREYIQLGLFRESSGGSFYSHRGMGTGRAARFMKDEAGYQVLLESIRRKIKSDQKGDEGARLSLTGIRGFALRVSLAVGAAFLSESRALPIGSQVFSLRQDGNILYIVHRGETLRVDLREGKSESVQTMPDVSQLKAETRLQADLNRIRTVENTPAETADLETPYLLIYDTDILTGDKREASNFAKQIGSRAGKNAQILLLGSHAGQVMGEARYLGVKGRFILSSGPEQEGLPAAVLTNVDNLPDRRSQFPDARFATVAAVVDENGKPGYFAIGQLTQYLKTLLLPKLDRAHQFFNRMTGYDPTDQEFEELTRGNQMLGARFAIRPLVREVSEYLRQLWTLSRSYTTAA